MKASAQFRNLTLCSIVFALVLTVAGCGSKPIDPRTAAPADALVYVETQDLGSVIASITESNAYQETAKTKPDVSALKGIQVAAVVTGFETSEKQLNEESTVLNFRPRFAAIIETEAWNWQAKSFAETQLGEFVNNAYGGGVSLESYDKKEGQYYAWTSEDGRKAFAIVQGSVVIFGNDESAIEKCLAVRRGESESMAANPKLSQSGEGRLAAGFISQDGMAQIANIAGVTMAIETGEEENVRSFIAGVLPEILRNSVTEMSWTAEKTAGGVADRVAIIPNPELAAVLSETIVPAGSQTGTSSFIPADFVSATRYNLKDPLIAWRSVVLSARRQTDDARGGLLAEFASSVFEPYGIANPELFLGSVGHELWTVKFDPEDDDPVTIVTVTDAEAVKRSIAEEVKFTQPPSTEFGSQMWASENGDTAAAFVGSILVLGSKENVVKCLQAKQSGNAVINDHLRRAAESSAAAVTVTRDRESAARIADVLSERKAPDAAAVTVSLTETRFNAKSIERSSESEFGLIGWLVEQLDGE